MLSESADCVSGSNVAQSVCVCYSADGYGHFVLFMLLKIIHTKDDNDV